MSKIVMTKEKRKDDQGRKIIIVPQKITEFISGIHIVRDFLVCFQNLKCFFFRTYLDIKCLYSQFMRPRDSPL